MFNAVGSFHLPARACSPSDSAPSGVLRTDPLFSGVPELSNPLEPQLSIVVSDGKTSFFRYLIRERIRPAASIVNMTAIAAANPMEYQAGTA